MRYQGKIASWNEAKGFGFIDWNGGNDRVFLHISAIEVRAHKPVVGDVVTYEVAKDEQGRFKATKVAFPRRDAQLAAPNKRSQLAWPRVAVVAVLLMVGVWLLQRYQHDETGGLNFSSAQTVPDDLARSGARTSAGATFSCDGRTHCSQMSSCEEATFFLGNCPSTEMDGDGDGVPCESQWCR